jgi:fused signal recognition particle receptor
METLKIPVKFIGVGEGIDDLRPFDHAEFINAIFEMAELKEVG